MKTYVILLAVTSAALLSPQLDIMVNTISIMIRYSTISTSAFLNLPIEKFLHLAMLTPSALIPQKQLNANISTNAKTKPFVGISQPKAYERHEVATNRRFSKVSRILLSLNFHSIRVYPVHTGPPYRSTQFIPAHHIGLFNVVSKY